MNELKLYYRNDPYYNMMRLTPSNVRMAIQNGTDYLFKLNLFDVIARDDQFMSKKQDRDSIFRKAEWSVETCGNTIIDDFVKKQLWKILNNNILQELHQAVYKGFSVAEIIWNKNNIEKLVIHPQKAFNFKDGNLYIYDRDKQAYHQIPENKTVQCFNPMFQNDIPVGIGEIIAPLVCIKYSALYRDWPHFNEFIAMPMLWGYYQSQNEASKKALREALESLGRASLGILPQGSDLKFIESKNSDPKSYDRIIDVCNNAISKIVVGQTLTTQSSASGSYAMAKVHGGVRNDILSESIDIVCDAINKYIVRPLVNFNFSQKLYPEFKLLNPASLEVKSIRDKNLYGMGVRFTPKYFIENYGLQEDDFVLQDKSSNVNLTDECLSKKKTLNFYS